MRREGPLRSLIGFGMCAKKNGAEHGPKTRMASLGTWPRGVTVSTLDSESSDRGSNPREAFQERGVPFKWPVPEESVAEKLA